MTDVAILVLPVLLLASTVAFELIGYGFVMRALGCIPLAGIILFITREGSRMVDSMIHWNTIMQLGENQNMFTNGLIIAKEISTLNCSKQLSVMTSTTIMSLALSIYIVFGISRILYSLYDLRNTISELQKEAYK
eukprot:TRINITY_DN15236_c2_g1_i1.p1 TRINITY_DN15236_c2_g1~~TRINITY_DN15236_c2_g1_i1.p1  ORF type:complete len:135 (+),score=15.90 TRINITY_DN15236_c2_g1_i1:46-450(+)